MSLSHQIISIAFLFLGLAASLVKSFATPTLSQTTISLDTQLNAQHEYHLTKLSRRNMIISGLVSLSTVSLSTTPANAKYVLNDDGDYDEVSEEDWQTAWKQRLDKANSMSKDEIFAAARGAGNRDLMEGEESDASKKRRAMSACRDSGLRSKVGVPDVKACNSRVMGGDVDFILSN